MILDNGKFHKAKKLSIPTGVQLKFLPPYSPELNPVERLWQDLMGALGFDFYEHLADLRQETRTVLSRYTDEAVASLTGYDYLLEAANVGLSVVVEEKSPPMRASIMGVLLPLVQEPAV